MGATYFAGCVKFGKFEDAAVPPPRHHDARHDATATLRTVQGR